MVRGVKLDDLALDITEALDDTRYYLMVEIENHLLVFLKNSWIKRFRDDTLGLRFMDENLDANWGLTQDATTYIVLRCGVAQSYLWPYQFSQWRLKHVRADEWKKDGLRDQLEALDMMVSREFPVIYLGD